MAGSYVETMDHFARIVFGYHGTSPAFAERLIRGEVAPADWQPSENEYDWLGRGIYFWEYAPDRARAWAGRGGVMGAIISLGECLDLLDVVYTDRLAEAYGPFVANQRRRKEPVPENRGKRRNLDCAVVNYAIKRHERLGGRPIQTVHGAFMEGDAVFPGSGILRESHIQIAVRDRSCILGVFRPT
jgi:hypothetical protein